MKKAFTLSETVVVLAVIGFLAVIMLNAIGGIQPDKEKIMFKKAYQTTERTVGELVNDEAIYPYDQEKIGFYNDSKAEVEGTDITFEGDQKFCQFFARKLNTFQDPVWDDQKLQCVFQTTDGIHWTVPSKFVRPNTQPVQPVQPVDPDNPDAVQPQQPGHFVRIEVDINGKLDEGGKGPDTKDETEEYRDIFEIIVEFDGRVRVDGAKETEFLRSHDSNKKFKN